MRGGRAAGATARSSLAPVVFFAHRRPEHTARALEALSRCEGAERTRLYVFCDGPRSPEQADAVERTRAVIRSRAWCGEVEVIEAQRNLGISASVLPAIARVLEEHGRAIVVEDDVVVSAGYLDYMNRALERYRDEPRVMHVAAFMWPIETSGLPETFLVRSGSPWGFGTWHDAWARFVPDASALMRKLNAGGLRHRFNMDGTVAAWQFLSWVAQGRVDSWAIRWIASIVLENGLCLNPRRPLVENIGHDGSGELCQPGTVLAEPDDVAPSGFPQRIAEDPIALERIKAFHRTRSAELRRRLWAGATGRRGTLR